MKIGKYGQINDMPRGWSKLNDVNNAIRRLWYRCFYRSYDEKYHESQPTYKDCECVGITYLSDFVEWIKSEPLYEEFCNSPLSGWCIDKDIKVENNKIYSPDTMTLTTKDINLKERNARCGNPAKKYPIIAIPLKDGDILYFDSAYDAQNKGDFDASYISKCCRGIRNTHKGYKWYYKEDYEEGSDNE